jgi:hypothetical protein
MKVKVYFNLTRKVFSIMDCSTGHVISHAECVHLADVKFRVQAGGRERVRREHKKYVHAFAQGELIFAGDEYLKLEGQNGTKPCAQAKYNPYLNETFVDSVTGEPVESASFAVLQGKKVFYN